MAKILNDKETRSTLWYCSCATAVGTVHIAMGEAGITDIAIAHTDDVFIARLESKYGTAATLAPRRFGLLLKKLDRYFKGAHVVFDERVAPAGTCFELSVWRAIRGIPRGSTLSYALLAAAAGTPRGARAVGNACAKNPVPIIVPCHRVLKGDGTIGGYTCGSSNGAWDIKRALLELEGAWPRTEARVRR